MLSVVIVRKRKEKILTNAAILTTKIDVIAGIEIQNTTKLLLQYFCE